MENNQKNLVSDIEREVNKELADWVKGQFVNGKSMDQVRDKIFDTMDKIVGA